MKKTISPVFFPKHASSMKGFLPGYGENGFHAPAVPKVAQECLRQPSQQFRVFFTKRILFTSKTLKLGRGDSPTLVFYNECASFPLPDRPPAPSLQPLGSAGLFLLRKKLKGLFLPRKKLKGLFLPRKKLTGLVSATEKANGPCFCHGKS